MADLVPRWLARTALVCGCALLIAYTAWLVAHALLTITTVTAAVVAALLLTALTHPAHALLRRLRLPSALAALATVVVSLAVVVGVLVVVVERIRAQQADFRSAVVDTVDRLRDYAAGLPFSTSQLDVGSQQLSDAALSVLPGPAQGAGLATQVLSGIALAVFLWFFLLKDGAGMWDWFVGWFPADRTGAVDRGGRAVWGVLTGYIRGTTVIAAADAVGIGLGMLVLGVPLTASLSCLVFLGAYVPIVGAVVTGALAVGVTLVTVGPVQALVLLGVVLVVQQVEGNLLQPLVMGRTLHLHPVAIVVSVTVGTLLAGVLGALVAVPLVAAVYRVLLQVRGRAPR